MIQGREGDKIQGREGDKIPITAWLERAGYGSLTVGNSNIINIKVNIV